jgi:hypothetical protein
MLIYVNKLFNLHPAYQGLFQSLLFAKLTAFFRRYCKANSSLAAAISFGMLIIGWRIAISQRFSWTVVIISFILSVGVLTARNLKRFS